MPPSRYLLPLDTKSPPRETTVSCAWSCGAGQPRRLLLFSSGTSCITQNFARPSASIPSRAEPFCRCRNYGPGSEWKARRRTRSRKQVQAAYAKGELPKMETVAFAYMFSADQDLGPQVGHWYPHMMVYTPYYENSMLGGNQVGGTLPFVGDDAGTPFAVTVIPVAHELAVKTQV